MEWRGGRNKIFIRFHDAKNRVGGRVMEKKKKVELGPEKPKVDLKENTFDYIINVIKKNR